MTEIKANQMITSNEIIVGKTSNEIIVGKRSKWWWAPATPSAQSIKYMTCAEDLNSAIIQPILTGAGLKDSTSQHAWVLNLAQLHEYLDLVDDRLSPERRQRLLNRNITEYAAQIFKNCATELDLFHRWGLTVRVAVCSYPKSSEYAQALKLTKDLTTAWAIHIGPLVIQMHADGLVHLSLLTTWIYHNREYIKWCASIQANFTTNPSRCLALSKFIVQCNGSPVQCNPYSFVLFALNIMGLSFWWDEHHPMQQFINLCHADPRNVQFMMPGKFFSMVDPLDGKVRPFRTHEELDNHVASLLEKKELTVDSREYSQLASMDRAFWMQDNMKGSRERCPFHPIVKNETILTTVQFRILEESELPQTSRTTMTLVAPNSSPSTSSCTSSSTSSSTLSSASIQPTGVKPTENAKPAVESDKKQTDEMKFTAVEKDSPEFWKVVDTLKANMNNAIDDYVKNRILANKEQLTFRLVSCERVENPKLAAQYAAFREKLQQRNDRTAADLKEHCAFHGTAMPNIKKICQNGLLRVGHPLNPSKAVDSGFFGVPQHGVYVSRYADYTFKYSNQLDPLEEGETCQVILFQVTPGRSLHIKKSTPGLKPTPGYDSHSSSNHQEWYLFDEAQCCPQYILKIKAIVNRRTDGDDR